VENLNLRRNNYPFGDLPATKDGVRYFIGVKARNEMRQGDVGLNESYNLVLISDPVNRRLKDQGKPTREPARCPPSGGFSLPQIRELLTRHAGLRLLVAVGIYRCFTGREATSTYERIGSEILGGRDRRYGDRIWIACRWNLACHHSRRERHRRQAEHQVHVDQHFAEIERRALSDARYCA
jgi:hypothetical protein